MEKASPETQTKGYSVSVLLWGARGALRTMLRYRDSGTSSSSEGRPDANQMPTRAW